MRYLIALIVTGLFISVTSMGQGSIENRAKWQSNVDSLVIESDGRVFRGRDFAKAYNGFANERYEMNGSPMSSVVVVFMDDALQTYVMAIHEPSNQFRVDPMDMDKLYRIKQGNPGVHFTIVNEMMSDVDAGFELLQYAAPWTGFEEIRSQAQSGRLQSFHQFHDFAVGYFDETNDYDFVKLASLKGEQRTAASVLQEHLAGRRSTSDQNANIEDLTAELNAISGEFERLERSLDEQLAENEIALNETAALGRDALKCDVLADTVFEQTGDPANGEAFNADAVKYMPREVFGYVDDCAEFQHGRLNFIAGVGRLTGLPLGYYSDAEAFDYFITASKYGYDYGAGAAGVVLTSKDEAPEWLTEQRFSDLFDALEAQGKDVRDLRLLGEKYLELVATKEQAAADLQRANTRLLELKTQFVQSCNSLKQKLSASGRRATQSNRAACVEVGIQLP